MPSILPASNLKHVIPMYTRASILAASVYAEMTPTDAFVITRVPEFHPPFEIYSLKTIPFAKQNQTSLYMKLNLKNKFVAVNSISETFLFNPNHCPTKKGIIICQPSAVEIHKVPTSCEELLVTSPKDNIELCTNATSFTTISVQSHIYLSKTEKVRIFSPFDDKLSSICGKLTVKDWIPIKAGYADLTIRNECTVYSKQLRIFSPSPFRDEVTVNVSMSIPDLSLVIDSLIDDIEVLHGINVESLSVDMQKFDKDITIDIADMQSMQTTVHKIQAIHELENFDPTQISLEKLHRPNEILKVVIWIVIVIIALGILVCINVCCPGCLCSMCVSLCKGTCECFKMCRKTEIYRKTNLHDSDAESPQQPGISVRFFNRKQPTRRKLDFEFETPTKTEEEEDCIFDQSSPMKDRPLPIQPNWPISPLQIETSFIPPNVIMRNPQPTAPIYSPPISRTSKPWTVLVLNQYRAMLCAQSNDMKYYYIPQTGDVHMADGTKSYAQEPPPENLIQKYKETMKTVEPVTLQNVIDLLNDKNASLDPFLKEFYVKKFPQERKYIYGFKRYNPM